jgi:hypothetical protein
MAVRQLTIRIPDELVQQIGIRAYLQRRTRNQEVIFLLESALSQSAAHDTALIQKMRQRQVQQQQTETADDTWTPPAVR